MRDRLWREPVPPRALNKDVPPWLQEVILRALHANADKRYQSAAHVAFDLRNPAQVPLSYRAARTSGPGFFKQLGRRWRARSKRGPGHVRRHSHATAAPVIMVAVDTEHPDDPRHPALQVAMRQMIALSPDFRLMCISVIRAAPLGEGAEDSDTASGKNLEHKIRLRHWIEPLRLPPSRLSLHVIESANPGDTLLALARTNQVSLIVLGAPGPEQKKLAWWRSAASGVTANAPCSVYVVRVPEHEREKPGA